MQFCIEGNSVYYMPNSESGWIYAGKLDGRTLPEFKIWFYTLRKTQ